MKIRSILAMFMAGMLALSITTPIFAQQDSTLGPVTNLPIPRFVSLKGTKANVRRGPSQSHRIDWILMHRGTPLQITAEFEHWRRVRDVDGAGGWIHYSLLSGARTIVVESERIALHATPTETSASVALVDRGVIAELGKCIAEWCAIDADGYDGWVRKTDVWGVGIGELRD